MPSKSTSYRDSVYTSILDFMDDEDFSEFSSAVNSLLRDGLEQNGIEVEQE